MISRSEWVRPGAYGVFYFDDNKTAYAEIAEPLEDEPGYVRCKVHAEAEAAGVFDVHVSRFVYPLTREQFVVAWYYGFPDHPRRLQAILNLVKGGDA